MLTRFSCILTGKITLTYHMLSLSVLMQVSAQCFGLTISTQIITLTIISYPLYVDILHPVMVVTVRTMCTCTCVRTRMTNTWTTYRDIDRYISTAIFSLRLATITFSTITRTCVERGIRPVCGHGLNFSSRASVRSLSS